MKNKLTKKQLNKMHEMSDKVQPDVVREKDCEGLSESDKEIYDFMNEKYKEMCSKGIPFSLCFLAPETLKPLLFYRFTEPEDFQKYKKVSFNLLDKMYRFIWHCGFIKYLEDIGHLKVLPPKEEMKAEIVVSNKDNE